MNFLSKIIIVFLVLAFVLALSSCKKDEDPIANFSIENNNCTATCTVSFTNVSLGTNNSFQWDFGDGSASLEENPSHEYTQQGTWTVTLNVTNDSGFSQIKKDVTILP